MTARDEAIEVMAQAYLLRLTGDDDRLIERIDDWDRGIAAVMYDAAEPIIRADEREEVAREFSLDTATEGWEIEVAKRQERERIAQDLERLAGIAVDPREALAYFSAARIARDGTR